jgi:exosortase C (VPDSG-CTERM-specific)
VNPELSEQRGAPALTGARNRPSAWAAPWCDLPHAERLRYSRYIAYLAVLTVLFIQPLIRLAVHAAANDLHSHVVLVPFITAYLLYIRRRSLPAGDRGSVAGAFVLAAAGIAALAVRFTWLRSLSVNDDVALMTLAFVSFAAAGGFLFLGVKWMTAAAFPVAFLIFMVPLPDAVVTWLEQVSVLASADAAAVYFQASGTPFVREDTIFALPGIVLRVAQECSGIRSSWVLFITSLLLSEIFLKSRWRKFVLVAFVIPLGVLRNGLRILIIGLLCVHIGPEMIDSVIHHRGGPIFFALSLVPLFLLLLWFRRQEKPASLPAENV